MMSRCRRECVFERRKILRNDGNYNDIPNDHGCCNAQCFYMEVHNAMASSALLNPDVTMNPNPAMAKAMSTIRPESRTMAIRRRSLVTSSSRRVVISPDARNAKNGRKRKTCSFVSITMECVHGIGTKEH